MTYRLYVLIQDLETNKPVDLIPTETADMEDLDHARLVARIMGGVL